MIHDSECGQAYVDDLEAIMRQNRLDAVDDAFLREMEIVRIVPKATETP